MTKGLTKRIVSFITTLTMAAALLPGTVFAENSGSEDVNCSSLYRQYKKARYSSLIKI